ncbi:MAG TPA: N-acetylglucosamine-6-phosphate deacetylase [Rhodospirillaceae bacterium]|nr:N-acetylglucosamine-6-phosphate deacetylase [Rhodospirillaceae bacterium]
MTAPSLPQSLPMALTDAIIFTGEVFVENQALLVKDGKIVDLIHNDKVPDDFKITTCANHILAPGFIDCQVNGGGNVLLNATPTVKGVLAIAAAHRKSGTTRLLPTCITDTPEVMAAATAATRQARKSDPSILGIHLEGPHISEEYSGAHNVALVRPLSETDFQTHRAESGECFIVTLAPEQVTPEQIARLVKQGVIVSLGHTQATTEQTRAALAAGAKGFTHLFTRMPPVKGRSSTVVGVALDDAQSWCGMIADGHHVTPELMRIAVRAKAKDKLFLVSDSAAPAGADNPQPFDWCGQKVFPQKDYCVNEQGVVSGAMLTLGECVPRCIRDVRLDPEKVLRMASTIPAEFLGLGDRLGKLLPTYAADIVMLDHSFKTQKVWKDGEPN